MRKIKKLLYAGIIPALACMIISCATTEPAADHEKELITTDKDKSAELLKLLDEINASSPETINAAFTADGETPGKKFRIEGRAVYDKKGFFYFSLVDYIFRSPVIDAYRDGDKLYFYYPADKKLLIDDVKKINFYNYSGFKADYGFIQSLFTGGIPVIPDYNSSKTLADGDDSYYLILENNEYYENIYFKKRIPEKILLMHKESRNKAEIYLKSLVRKDRSYFYKNIKIVAPGQRSSINLIFSKPVLNEAVKVQSVEALKKKSGIEVVKIN